MLQLPNVGGGVASRLLQILAKQNTVVVLDLGPTPYPEEQGKWLGGMGSMHLAVHGAWTAEHTYRLSRAAAHAHAKQAPGRNAPGPDPCEDGRDADSESAEQQDLFCWYDAPCPCLAQLTLQTLNLQNNSLLSTGVMHIDPYLATITDSR
jgi:hypothetical protein